MNVDNLMTMANQIGQFFEAMHDREEALEGIARHLRKFWAPRMREQLSVYRGNVAGQVSCRSCATRWQNIRYGRPQRRATRAAR